MGLIYDNNKAYYYSMSCYILREVDNLFPYPILADKESLKKIGNQINKYFKIRNVNNQNRTILLLMIDVYNNMLVLLSEMDE